MRTRWTFDAPVFLAMRVQRLTVAARRSFGLVAVLCTCATAEAETLAQAPASTSSDPWAEAPSDGSKSLTPAHGDRQPGPPATNAQVPDESAPSWARHAKPTQASPVAAKPRLSPDAQMHDGLFLRFEFGGSLIFLKGPGNSSALAPGFALDIELGLALTRQIVLYVGIAGAVLPTEVGPEIAGTPTVGLLYYFPSNLFIGGGLGAGRMFGIESINSDKRKTNLGILLKLEAGREWWVSDNWAFGCSVQLLAALAKENGHGGELWEGNALSALFSATYN
jgi:hypothetical protein